MMPLKMPFTYDAYVLPTPRHRIPREAILRGYTDVAVLEVALADLTPAIELSDGKAPITLYAYRGRLFREARSRLTGEPLRPAEFELALSEHRSWTATLDGQVETPFDDKFFPIVNEMRSHFAWATESSAGPMSRNVLSYESKLREWQKPVVRDSNEQHQRALAQHHYEQSVVIVDGLPFVSCTEPVWQLRTWPKPYSLVSNATPGILDARHAFRLDERNLAEAWCWRCGMRRAIGRADITVLNDAFLTRDTVVELALSAITPLRRLGLLAPGTVAGEEGAALTARLADGQRVLDPWEAVLLLDTVAEIYDCAVQYLFFDENRGDWRHTRTIVARWRFERQSGRDLSGYAELSEDDLAALEGITY